MIRKLIVKNVASIYNEIEISFMQKGYEFLKENVINGVVNPAVFYGANGTGKSTLLKIFDDIREIMNRTEIDLLIHNRFVNNGFNSEQDWSSRIAVEFEIEKNIYFYDLHIAKKIEDGESVKRIQNEVLTINNKSYLDMPYDKETNGMISYLSKIGGSINNQKIKAAYNFLKNIVFISSKNEIFSNEISNRNVIKGIYKYGDEIINIIKSSPLNAGELGFPIPFQFVKNELEDNKVYLKLYENHKTPFDLEGQYFSKGTIKILEYLSMMLILIKSRDTKEFTTPILVVIDEFDTSLHSLAIKFLAEIFASHEIQLIYSSHKTLEMRYMRPDQVYISRIKNYSSSYRRGSDIEGIREMHNLEKLYLSGRLLEDEFD